MLKKYYLATKIIALVLLIVTGVPSFAPGSGPQANAAYIEPQLAADTAEMLSVIVSARSAGAAARAVNQVGGQVTSELWLIDAVGAQVNASRLDELANLSGVQSVVANKTVAVSTKKNPDSTPVQPLAIATQQPTAEPTAAPTVLPTWTFPVYPRTATDGWMTNFRFPVPWDGSPDVQVSKYLPTMKLVYPYAIDIGVEYAAGLTGAGVTIAVVDSGVDIPPLGSDELEKLAGLYFLGQADFASPTCNKITIDKKVTLVGDQNNDNCFTTVNYSVDPYGHGTHVAGTIWNKLIETQTFMPIGVASNSKILSVRVLGPDGSGTYETVIKGIQYVVENQSKYGIRVLNLSLSATPSTPYFIDPLDRAVESAWAEGIVVLAAAGNSGPAAETISVPGNDPYVITVGALDGQRTPGYWTDDRIPSWSASGPTLDGFIKPDLVAPGSQIVAYMYSSLTNPADSAYLALNHPDYSHTESLFRMNGTSMATAITSGAVAVLLQAYPKLTPDQVKYRLMATARPVDLTTSGLVPNPLQQGAGRLWLPDAIFGITEEGNGNAGMDLETDLAAGWGYLDTSGIPIFDADQLAKHYLGSVRKSISDDGNYFLYFAENQAGERIGLGITSAVDNLWQPASENTTWTMTRLSGGEAGELVWMNGALAWNSGSLFDGSGRLVWSGGYLALQENTLVDMAGRLVWSGADLFDASGRLAWSGGRLVWSGGSLIFQSGASYWSAGELFDSAGRLVWSGGDLLWSGSDLLDGTGRLVWSGGDLFDASGRLVWSGGRLVWSGGQLLDASGRLVWSGGRLAWSGSLLQDASAGLVWSGGRLVWSGGRLVWSGNWDWVLPIESSTTGVSVTKWVNWD